MTDTKTAAVILAAGLGTRMKSAKPKVLHPLAGRSLLGHVLETATGAGLAPIVVVTGEGMDAVADAAKPHPSVIQKPALGTGHAVLAARDALRDFGGDVLVLFGADPLVEVDTIEAMLEAKQAGSAIVVLGFEADEPGDYGRLVVSAEGALQAIVEAKEATPQELEISLCNSGVMLIDGGLVWDLLGRVGNDNAKGEYYLTDIIKLAREDGLACAVVTSDEAELIGIDSRADLAVAEAIIQERLCWAAMEGGATLTDPASVTFCWDTKTGRDVTIGPNVVFGPGVSIGDNVEILAFCHIEGATVASGARIGPFARLRPGAAIAEDAHIGNFVEIKNSDIEPGAKVNHLTYIGDSRVGALANIGAGTITCNYDGFNKHHTDIGRGAFIGSNVALVAPVKIGDGAIIGAGSVITKDVDADNLAIARAPQKQIKKKKKPKNKKAGD
ncbi:MAG: bifunctional UDP-N-acetylglucosamine diphosphorylase/glucosamine-1-phosphate N-acetyltransferase GlmU [Proteobacteria bacterium]|nr:bifunctional UDP-N-acetylglucosamine diphosphorylase/glucosamine-1-phosphate N-acetyltransferase GlmU [Pseudomonadota bacterium]MDA1023181.1 bifunctional UDP-N-acetylglucosamine diphosphorylase/glucosamine-1-phosphate N-acetyltransferase GlmU [Pseudomonadota bacterium]